MVADRPPRDAAVAPVRPGEELDWASVGRWLRTAVPELRGPLRVLQFPHGRANLTYLLEVGGARVVLRRPPFGPLPPGGHDMRREYRVLSRLWRVYDRAPRAYAFTDDPSVAGADCFVMEYRRGEVIRDRLPASMRGHLDARSVEPPRGDELGRRLMFALVDAMAELHLVDPADCDLADLGKPEGFVARQVSGWARRWELAAPPGADPLMTEVGKRLAATLPRTQQHGIVHNDLKLDNCQFDPANPDRVTSVFDWDMATLGDPLVDLGTLLGYTPDVGDPDQAQDAVRYPPELELPSRAEIVARYAERTGADVSGITWYLAFARWKTATVYQQLANRAQRGQTSDPRNAALSDTITALAESAAALLDDSG
jgi:aminoglycoside phosphotransferase (APT) family kinase protein